MESEVIVASECPQSAGTDSTALDGRHSVSDLFGRGQRRRRRQRPPSNVVAVQLPQKRQLLHRRGIVDVVEKQQNDHQIAPKIGSNPFDKMTAKPLKFRVVVEAPHISPHDALRRGHCVIITLHRRGHCAKHKMDAVPRHEAPHFALCHGLEMHFGAAPKGKVSRHSDASSSDSDSLDRHEAAA